MSSKLPFTQTLRLSSPNAPLEPGAAMLVGLGLGFTLYFVARGWLNAAVVLLFFFATWQLYVERREPALAAVERKPLLWLVAALVSPLLAVLAVQLLRQEFVLRYFDAPLRFLMCAVILWCLARRRVNFAALAGVAFPVAVILCAGMIFLLPGASRYFWGDRVATYFMDPLSLSQHVTIAGFLCLFLVDAAGQDATWLRALKYIGFAVAIGVALSTGSRSGWVMMPVLTALWLIGFKRHNSMLRALVVVAAILSVCVGAYFLSQVVHQRVDLAVRDTTEYFTHGLRDTSIGIRLSLLEINWLLFLQHPLVGWGFNGTPDIASMPQVAALTTPMVEGYRIHSGGHNELMQNMMRMGVFGLASRLLLFLVPLAFFARAARSVFATQRTNGYLGLVVVVGYTLAGLSTEVFNLIYAASYYGLLVAAFGAPAATVPVRADSEP